MKGNIFLLPLSFITLIFALSEVQECISTSFTVLRKPHIAPELRRKVQIAKEMKEKQQGSADHQDSHGIRFGGCKHK